MTGRVHIILLMIAAGTIVSCSGNINRKFAELDREIERADSYMESFRHREDSLENTLAEDLSDSLKWEICYDLFSSFIHLNLDSTVRYCGELERYASNEDLKARTLACKLNCLRLFLESEPRHRRHSERLLHIHFRRNADQGYVLQRHRLGQVSPDENIPRLGQLHHQRRGNIFIRR